MVVAIGEFGRSPQKSVSASGDGNVADGFEHALGAGLRPRRHPDRRSPAPARSRRHSVRPRAGSGDPRPAEGNGNSADGRDHWPYCYTAVLAGAGIRRGHIHGESDRTASAPRRDPVHPGELLATIYHAFGIAPDTMVRNHLNQPRELVQANAVPALFG